MPLSLVVIFAVLIASAGTYYVLFPSPAAGRLAAMEGPVVNERRRRLRRANGAVLLGVAGLFVVGSLLNPHWHPWLYLATWGGLIFLLAVVLSLATIDVRLTAALRRNLRR